MDGLKSKVIDGFNDRNDLMTKIENLTRKTAVIPALELQVHDLKHREKAFRRNSSVFGTVSCLDLPKSKDQQDGKIQMLNEELNAVKAKIEKLELENGRNKSDLAAKNEENQNLNRKIQKMAECFKVQLTEKDNTIRGLNEVVVDLKGQIRVAVRVREYDIDQAINSGFTVISQSDIKFEQNGQQGVYHFEHLFQPNVDQAGVFDEIKELILCALHGRNVCLIAYGPTGTGKTFTMRGESAEGASDGVIPRAIRFLLQQSKEDLAAIGWKYKFSASFIEVYNEDVFDLLDGRKKLDVKISGAVTNVSGLRKLPIKSDSDVNVILSVADSQRSTASTACNLQSSRSHALFQIYVEGSKSTGESVNCCLNLVDLAGSERAKESGAQGKQFTEMTNINQSLGVLKKCIRSQMSKMTCVPYRESKLTMLLREYLGAGSSKTMFIAHINPRDVQETKRTLEFTSDLRSTSIGKATIQTGQRN